MQCQTRKTRLAQVNALRGPVAPNYSRAEIEEMPGDWLGWTAIDKGGKVIERPSNAMGRNAKLTPEGKKAEREARVAALTAHYAANPDVSPFPDEDLADRLVTALANMGRRGFSTTRLLSDDRSGQAYE